MMLRRLGNKMLLAMLAVIFAMAASFLIYFISFVSNMFEAEKREDGITVIRSLAQSTELGILTGEERFLQGPFKGVISNPSIVYVMAYDRDGRLIKSDAKIPVNTAITLTFNENIKPGPSYANIILNSPSGAFTTAISGNTLTVTPTTNLPYDRWTQLKVPADAVLTTSGTPMAPGTFITTFTTVAP